jgi:hypothetical protein
MQLSINNIGGSSRFKNNLITKAIILFIQFQGLTYNIKNFQEFLDAEKLFIECLFYDSYFTFTSTYLIEL